MTFKAALFAAGYVIGARAGRERYAQMVSAVASAAKRLDEFSSGHPASRPGPRSGGADSGS